MQRAPAVSTRGYDRILKVARTAADLGGSPVIRMEDLSKAIHYRSLELGGVSAHSINCFAMSLLGKVFRLWLGIRRT